MARRECESTYHRFFALEPFFDDKTGAVTIITVCTNCSKLVRYDLNLSTQDAAKILE
jgi:hypothetical protein